MLFSGSGHNLHEMLNSLFSRKNKEKCFRMLTAEIITQNT